MKKSILTALLLLVSALVVRAADITVHGTVVSAADQEPLIGASVLPQVAGLNGVATDFDGNFTLTVPEGTSLKVTYIGYKPQTVTAAPNLKIEMIEDASQLDEVVVVGYQTVRKADLTGAVAVMDMKVSIDVVV